MKFLKYTILLIILITIIGFLYLENSIDNVIEKDMQNFLFEDIENTQPLPKSFIQTIEKHYPNKFKQGVWRSIFNQVIGNPRNQCQCREIYFPHYSKNHLLAAEILALEIEDNFSQKRCYEYILNTNYFGFKVKGVQEAAQHYFDKDIDALNEEEVLKLDLLLWKPYYSRDIVKLNQRVKEIMLN